MALEFTDKTLNEVLAQNKIVIVDFCYCGNPIDLRNPDCITFHYVKNMQTIV